MKMYCTFYLISDLQLCKLGYFIPEFIYIPRSKIINKIFALCSVEVVFLKEGVVWKN